MKHGIYAKNTKPINNINMVNKRIVETVTAQNWCRGNNFGTGYMTSCEKPGRLNSI
jgi:hypothetical protein